MVRIIPEKLLKISRALRKNQTPWERKLWVHLRAHRFLSVQFKRQVSIGGYVVDFCCRGKRLIIELDGGQHNERVNEIKDQDRDQFLKSQGYKILRFWNNEVDQNLGGVLDKIRLEIFNPSPDLSPQKERGGNF